MEFLVLFGVIVVIVSPVVYFWIRGFDYMNKNHPYYTGNDLFGLDDDDKTQIG
jgi:uncharacterized protein (UPF0333 family)